RLPTRWWSPARPRPAGRTCPPSQGWPGVGAGSWETPSSVSPGTKRAALGNLRSGAVQLLPSPLGGVQGAELRLGPGQGLSLLPQGGPGLGDQPGPPGQVLPPGQAARLVLPFHLGQLRQDPGLSGPLPPPGPEGE